MARGGMVWYRPRVEPTCQRSRMQGGGLQMGLSQRCGHSCCSVAALDERRVASTGTAPSLVAAERHSSSSTRPALIDAHTARMDSTASTRSHGKGIPRMSEGIEVCGMLSCEFQLVFGELWVGPPDFAAVNATGRALNPIASSGHSSGLSAILFSSSMRRPELQLGIRAPDQNFDSSEGGNCLMRV